MLKMVKKVAFSKYCTVTLKINAHNQVDQKYSCILLLLASKRPPEGIVAGINGRPYGRMGCPLPYLKKKTFYIILIKFKSR